MLAGFDISDLDLGSQVTNNQIAQIRKLIEKKDFSNATLDVVENKIIFAYWDEYEAFVTFLKKLIIIKQDIYTHLTIENRQTEEYWLIEIMGNKLEECYGNVFWGNSKDRLRIKNILLTHLEATPEKVEQIIDDMVLAIKGEFDHLEDVNEEEPTKEELEQLEKEYKEEESQENYLKK